MPSKVSRELVPPIEGIVYVPSTVAEARRWTQQQVRNQN